MSPIRPSKELRPVGRSVEGRSIDAYSFGHSEYVTLIIAGMHGDEPKGVFLARKLIDRLAERNVANRVVIVPVVNPDGYQLRQRRNANGVDLNRNFPTVDWSAGPKRSRYHPGPSAASEPETRTLIKLVNTHQPRTIITIHSINGMRRCNNYDGPARELAEAMSKLNGYPVTEQIGYPTPGSLGTWAGRERDIPTVTLELPSHHSRQRCWKDNQETLLIACCAVPEDHESPPLGLDRSSGARQHLRNG